MYNVPLVYSFIYYRLKKKCNRDNCIHVNYIKENIWRVLKNNGGVPRYYTSDIIEELIKMKLIKRINNNGRYMILPSCCDKSIKRKESLIE